MAWETTWHIFLDSFGIGINLLILSFIVFCIGLYRRRKGVRTRLFSMALLIAFVGIAYWTLHGRILQLIFPISLPENPFDSVLIANYLSTVALTFVFFPLLFLYLFRRLDAGKLGLKIENLRYTLRLTFIGVCVNLVLSVVPTLVSVLASWEYKWPFEYTMWGLMLWFVFVTGVATWMQVFFFKGVLFHNYLDSENAILLFFISTLTFLMLTPLSIFTPIYVAGFGVEAYLTKKTGNVYGAMLIRTIGVAISTILVIV